MVDEETDQETEYDNHMQIATKENDQEIENEETDSDRELYSSNASSEETTGNLIQHFGTRKKEEKKGGKPFNLRKNLPFISCIDDCMLMDVGFNGNNFTQCNNNKKKKKKILNRLDRLLVNSEWEDIFPTSTVQHLARVSSDHCPLPIQCNKNDEEHHKYFRFLDFWIEQIGFNDIVKEA
ncbi:uncharacterized protein [Nicotiana tomentosiformis]|uniref:uncharacterized protein n=1 Tax=Nicotiana tomentosiformis TaxID=4098 RepID=UPI00388CEAEC